ncbi:hypothetical protein TNCV_1040731 [Trichonephila clavipes]|nr:hypothetical protein TNCV_1040731 [Trichonephila clavipes]
MRAIGDGYRNFEPWSSDEDDTRADSPSKLQHQWKDIGRFKVHRPPLHGGSSVAPRIEPSILLQQVQTRTIRLPVPLNVNKRRLFIEWYLKTPIYFRNPTRPQSGNLLSTNVLFGRSTREKQKGCNLKSLTLGQHQDTCCCSYAAENRRAGL